MRNRRPAVAGWRGPRHAQLQVSAIHRRRRWAPRHGHRCRRVRGIRPGQRPGAPARAVLRAHLNLVSRRRPNVAADGVASGTRRQLRTRRPSPAPRPMLQLIVRDPPAAIAGRRGPRHAQLQVSAIHCRRRWGPRPGRIWRIISDCAGARRPGAIASGVPGPNLHIVARGVRQSGDSAAGRAIPQLLLRPVRRSVRRAR